jgi:glycosyltransferase involved in cell wall biosynthesis
VPEYLKILMLVAFHPFQTFSGTEIYAGNLARSLESLGCEVHIVCTDEQADTQQVTQGITLTKVSATRYPFFGVFNNYYNRINAVKRLLNKSKFDAVLAVGTGQGLVFRDLARTSSHPPLVYFTFDCMKREGDAVLKVLSVKKASISKRNKTIFRYFKLTFADKVSCKFSDLILASSADTKRCLSHYYKIGSKKIKVIYAGVPEEYTHGFQSIVPPEPTFLHVATDHERKGTVYFLKALSLVKKKYNISIKSIIVGRKDPAYVNMAKRYGINATFIDTKLSKHKEIYASCTALVVPSVSEGFCLPVIEAAMFVKPAIVSDAGSLPELVEDGLDGYITPAADVNRLAECIFVLATHPEIVEQMSLKAKAKACRFEINAITKNILSTIEEFSDIAKKK